MLAEKRLVAEHCEGLTPGQDVFPLSATRHWPGYIARQGMRGCLQRHFAHLGVYLFRLLFLRAVAEDLVRRRTWFGFAPTDIGQMSFERIILDENGSAVDNETERAIVAIKSINGTLRNAEAPGGIFDGYQIWLRTLRAVRVQDAC